ncbi:MAG TPA: hypothetical protein PKV73_08835 [Agriterribacter sp.]|nr:hypothetical protein [Agriterribacter sp.]
MHEPDERPPLFKGWNTWYLTVAGMLVLMIILFHYFTKYFS